MGPEIASALADPRTQEIMVNPDGALRIDRLGEGRIDTGVRIPPAQVERIIGDYAHRIRVVKSALPLIPQEGDAYGVEVLTSGTRVQLDPDLLRRVRIQAFRAETLKGYLSELERKT